MRKICLLLISIVYSCFVFAQNGRISGQVLDARAKSPLAGATIEVNGKTVATTNEKGEFGLDCSGSVNMVVSFSGFEPYRIKVNCGEQLKIALNPSLTSLDVVEVTASSNPNKSQLEQPRSIVKMSETELNRATGLFLDDAINTNVPGVFMERRTYSAGQQLNIRGYGNGIGIRGINSNFDGQGLKMYLNGIPVTDAEGITVMDDIDYGSLGLVEILKGPSGTLYGLSIAGVVNLQTQKAEKNKVSVGQDFQVGSYGQLRTTTRVSIGGERSSILANYGYQKFDGFMPHTNARKDYVNLMGDINLNAKQDLFFYLGYTNSNDERNGELTKEQYANFDYTGNPAYIKNNAHSAVKTFRAGVGHTYHFNEHISNTTSLFGSAQSMDNSSAGGWTDKSPLNYGLRSTLDMQFNLSEKVLLSGIIGMEGQKMRALTVGYGMGLDSTNPAGYNVITSIRSDQATTNSTFSYFTQWTLGLPMGFSATAGVGISSMRIKLEDRLWGLNNNRPGNTKLQVYETKYNGLVSPSFAINKKIGKSASVYASWSVGHKAPVSSNILISTTGELNTGLKPEKGTQLEFGTKGSMLNGRLFYTVAAFFTKFRDKFTTVAVPNPSNTATLYSYIVNGGELKNNGLELLLKYDILNSSQGFFTSIQPFANLTFSDFNYGDFQYQRVGKNVSGKDSLIIDDYNGNQVAGVSPWVYNLGVDVYTRVGIYGNINFNHRSEMYFTSDELNQTSPYSLLNARFGYRSSFGRFGLDVYAGANNITGSQYYYMVFVNQLPDAYIPAPHEINYYGGLNLRYTF